MLACELGKKGEGRKGEVNERKRERERERRRERESGREEDKDKEKENIHTLYFARTRFLLLKTFP